MSWAQVNLDISKFYCIQALIRATIISPPQISFLSLRLQETVGFVKIHILSVSILVWRSLYKGLSVFLRVGMIHRALLTPSPRNASQLLRMKGLASGADGRMC